MWIFNFFIKFLKLPQHYRCESDIILQMLKRWIQKIVFHTGFFSSVLKSWPALFHIRFNGSILSGRVPSQWLTAIVNPIPKTPQPPHIRHLGPISVTHIFSRVVEHLIVNKWLRPAIIMNQQHQLEFFISSFQWYHAILRKVHPTVPINPCVL